VSDPSTEALADGSGGNADHAYDQIRQAIIEGRYAAGQRLIEQRLAAEFGLSRTPVREAVRRLEAEGMVVTERNRGATVRPITATEIADSYELRSRLEGLAVERAAVRATPEDLERLVDANREFTEAIPPRGDTESIEAVRLLNAANRRFHVIIAEVAAYPRLAEILQRTVDTSLVFQALRHFDHPEAERSAIFHGLIAEAVAAGEGRRGAHLMEEHVLLGRDVLLAHLEASGSVAALFDPER
jgi:DNA-binding GntR family transcriptional regulator